MLKYRDPSVECGVQMYIITISMSAAMCSGKILKRDETSMENANVLAWRDHEVWICGIKMLA